MTDTPHSNAENQAYEVFAATKAQLMLTECDVDICNLAGGLKVVSGKKYPGENIEWTTVLESMTSSDVYDDGQELDPILEFEIDFLFYTCWTDNVDLSKESSIYVVPPENVVDTSGVPTYESVSPTTTGHHIFSKDNTCYIVGEVTSGQNINRKFGQLNKVVAALRKIKEYELRSKEQIEEDANLDVLSIFQYVILVIPIERTQLNVEFSRLFRNRKWIKRLRDAGRFLIMTVPWDNAGEMSAFSADSNGTSVAERMMNNEKLLALKAHTRSEEAKARIAERAELRDLAEKEAKARIAERAELRDLAETLSTMLDALYRDYNADMTGLDEDARAQRKEMISQDMEMHKEKLKVVKAKYMESVQKTLDAIQ